MNKKKSAFKSEVISSKAILRVSKQKAKSTIVKIKSKLSHTVIAPKSNNYEFLYW